MYGEDSASTFLWYSRPAQEWREALPVGGGRLAAWQRTRGDPETALE